MKSSCLQENEKNERPTGGDASVDSQGRLRDQIDALQPELSRIVLGQAAPQGGGKRRMSASAIARISARQEARWARVKVGFTSEKETTHVCPGPRRNCQLPHANVGKMPKPLLSALCNRHSRRDHPGRTAPVETNAAHLFCCQSLLIFCCVRCIRLRAAMDAQ